MVAKVLSVAAMGFDGRIIEVESDAGNPPSLQIVGLDNKVIEETKERMRSGVKNSLLDFLAKKTTVFLSVAPYDERYTTFNSGGYNKYFYEQTICSL